MKKSAIFTRLTNETRDDNNELVRKHKMELAELDPLKQTVKPRYLNYLQHEKVMISEVESILDSVNSGSKGQRKPLNRLSSMAVASTSSLGSIKQGVSDRVEEITADWVRGPAAMGQVCKFCL
jgi:hypothetical protein